MEVLILKTSGKDQGLNLKLNVSSLIWNKQSFCIYCVFDYLLMMYFWGVNLK